MTHRIPLDHLTSDQYDALCNELAALRAVARGYCPACGRGDAAPTVADWEQQKQRADQAEELLCIAHDTSNKSETERARAAQRAETAERDAEIYRKRLARLTDGYAEQFRRLEAAEAQRDELHRRCLNLLGDHGIASHRLDLIRDAARLHRQQLISINELYAVVEALDQPAPAAATQATDTPKEPRVPACTTGLVVQPYRNDRGDPAWVFRCWGTDTCDGWLSLDHATRQSAERARDRHIAEEHATEPPHA